MANKIITGVLAATVSNLGTLVVSYPNKDAPESGVTNAGDFFGSISHNIIIGSSNVYKAPNQVELTFGTSNITVTNRSGGAWLAGSTFTLELGEDGKEVYADDGRTKIAACKKLTPVEINFGAPDAVVATAVLAAQVITINVNATINGTLATSGVAILDVPRCVSAVSNNVADNNTRTLTVFGTDAYGVALRENFVMNGTTTVIGKKAFKTITRVTSNVTTTGTITIGTNTNIGVPVFVGSSKDLDGYQFYANGVVDAPLAVAFGIQTAGGSTATTGDVRGTVVFGTAPNGTNVYTANVLLKNAGYKGIPQFNG